MQSAWWPLLRLVGLALPPYVALQTGLVSMRDLGLAELDWIQRFGLGLAVSGALLLMLLVASWQFRHVNLTLPAPAPQQRFLLPLQTAAEQLLWALLRFGAASFLRSQGVEAPAAAYLGAWLGLALLYLAWVGDPTWRQRFRQPSRQRHEIIYLALALATTVVFLVSGNLWLSWVLHTLALLIV